MVIKQEGSTSFFRVTQTLDNFKGIDIQPYSSVYQDMSGLNIVDKDFEVEGIIVVGSVFRNILRGKGDML